MVAILEVTRKSFAEELQPNHNQGWLDMAILEGPTGPIMTGVWHRVTSKSLVWYPKKAFDAGGYEVSNGSGQ
jgi:alpha-glucoside transport system substrate-binding protein